MNGQDAEARWSRFAASLLPHEPVVEHFRHPDGEGHEILALIYQDVPAFGQVTGFTYGLSETAGHELTLTVRSHDPEWARVPARMASVLQGRHPFRRGQIISRLDGLVAGSTMTSILLGPPVVGSDGGGADVVGMYPIYDSERDLALDSGVDSLWDLTWDRLDPARPPVA